MSTSTEKTTLTVALIGNPNTGKSTLFGAMVGVHQHVGNYPGVTVEKKTGEMSHAGCDYEVIDLPGLYSLAPRSRDEMVAVDVLLGRLSDVAPVDAVVCVADASNLERNLYLLNQVLELNLPTVMAVNMLDVANDHGIDVDVEKLNEQLPIAVVATQANRRIGIDEVKEALGSAIREGAHESESPFPKLFEEEVERMRPIVAEFSDDKSPLPDCLVRRLILDVSGYLEKALFPHEETRLREEIAASRGRLAEVNLAVPKVETTSRYDWARQTLDGVVSHPDDYQATTTDRIDSILTHRFWGTILFFALMVVVFQAVFSWAGPLMDLIDGGTGALGAWVESMMAEGAFRSLIVDGIIGGVGGVVIFLPQILILFLFIAVLEDCGYMARAAYLMDKLMTRVGLSGKSFIPMLSSFACAIPGIMAARVIENERDRLTTILVAPLMTCSARLPVYALLIAAFVPSMMFFEVPLLPKVTLFGIERGPLTIGLGLQGLVLLSLYMLGIIIAVCAALVFKRTLFRGESPPFLMELPSYKWPSPRVVVFRVLQRGWLFLKCAGTLILLVSVLVWAALYFPHNTAIVEGPFQPQIQKLEAEQAAVAEDSARYEEIEQELAAIDNEIVGAYQRQSFLGRLGQVIEPAVRPLGWDWRIGCSVIASLPAREIVVATMGVMYNAGADVDIESDEGLTQMQTKLKAATWDDDPERHVFNLPVALSILVFFALCAQCAATLAVMRRETNSWRWPLFAFTYMTGLAYVGALITYQVGMWIIG
jgi:ferrous iron transport protein B